MTSVYPMQEKSNAPPTYEQATYYSQAPPMPPFPGVYSASPIISQPYEQPPPMGMYLSNTLNVPPVGTPILITTRAIFYGDMPIQCICPNCYQPIVTRVEKTTGLVPWLICIGILLLGCWLGCCLIPFCLDSLKSTEHYCPNCVVLLGIRRRM